MRPVERGDAPPGATTFDEMRPTLLDRLGRYCSYCEYPVKHAPHGEHIIPKDKFPAWEHRWDNLAVACSWCNGHKGKDRPAPDRVDREVPRDGQELLRSRDDGACATPRR